MVLAGGMALEMNFLIKRLLLSGANGRIRNVFLDVDLPAVLLGP